MKHDGVTFELRWSVLARSVRCAVGASLVFALSVVSTAAVQDLAGRYEGAWTNLTFGSLGKAVITIEIQGTNASLKFDMDGYVFGQIDPPLIDMPGTVQGDFILIDNLGVGMFGDIKGSVDAAQGTLSVALSNIPGGYIQKVVTAGSIGGGVIQLDYTVDFPGPASPTNPAKGVMRTVRSEPLRITRVFREGNNLVLEWVGGRPPYTVQLSPDLSGSAWLAVGTPTTGATARIGIPGGGMGFIRVAGQP